MWLADFTYLRCWEGVVFFSFVIDAFTRRIVGWQFASHMRTDLVLDALRMALARRAAGADVELVHHSDAGSQYTSHDFAQVLDDHGVLASIGSVGDAYDNAMAESFVDSFKTELIADRVWRTRSQLELAIVEYVGWFNDVRLHESLGDLPPAEFETLSPSGTVHLSSHDRRGKPTKPVSAEPSPAQISRKTSRCPRIPSSSSVRVDAASAPSTSCGSCVRPTPAPSPARSVRCCAARACTRRC